MKIKDEECRHVWEKVGLWDGRDQETKERTGGPVFKCKECGEKKMLKWEEDLRSFEREKK
jgi:DNA-directed RNA polymerase subunit M/transcription elongation factor TFIIS